MLLCSINYESTRGCTIAPVVLKAGEQSIVSFLRERLLWVYYTLGLACESEAAQASVLTGCQTQAHMRMELHLYIFTTGWRHC